MTYPTVLREKPVWAGPYLSLGFVHDDENSLTYRHGDSAIQVVSHTHDLVAVDAYDGQMVFDRPDLILPKHWSVDLVSAALRGLVQGLSRREWRAPTLFQMKLTDAERIFATGRDQGDTGFLAGHLAPGCHLMGRPRSPRAEAARIIAAQSANRDLLHRVVVSAAQDDIRRIALANPYCPTSAKREALSDESLWQSLVHHVTLPTELVEPLFLKVAVGSTRSQRASTVAAAATHPQTPINLVPGIIEKSLELRLEVLTRAMDLEDPSRRDLIAVCVLSRTRWGTTAKAALDILLGEDGLRNEAAVNWLRKLPDYSVRSRVSRWLNLLTDGDDLQRLEHTEEVDLP